MGLIAVGGFQHETNTFAPSKADYAAFEDGGGWPPLTFGEDIAPRLAGANIPAAGALAALHAMGHRTVGLVWGAASPSARVTRDAYERIVGEMMARLVQLRDVDGVYLDLHGAMVTEHLDDGEGELLARVGSAVGLRVPVVASLARILMLTWRPRGSALLGCWTPRSTRDEHRQNRFKSSTF